MAEYCQNEVEILGKTF